MRIAVLDHAALGMDLCLDSLNVFGECADYENTRPDQAAQRLQGVQVAVLNKVRLTSEVLKECPSLRLICLCGTGYDHVDVKFCHEHGIGVCNVPDYCTDSVAQLTVAMALSLYCHLPQYHAYVADGHYSSGNAANRLEPVYHEIAGRTWGILGLGHIGTRVGEIAQAMGCRVIGYRRRAGGKYPCVDLNTLCRESDILSLHVPLTEQTRGIIGEKELAMMKPNAVLINVARGAVTDEAAVAGALMEGRLGGFGCDVYSAEPMPKSHPYYAIRQRDDVCFTPHMAWGSYEARIRVIAEVCENIRSYERGEKRNRVD